MILRTERLIVRPWQRVDLDRMAAWPRFPDPLDAQWNWPQLLRAHGTADLFFLARAHDPCRLEWTITTQAGAVIGHLGIRAIQQAERQAQLGIGLGYPFLQQGYGTEALSAFLHAFFGTMGFQTLHLQVAAHNARARRVYHRLGFREVGALWQRVGPSSDFGFLSGPAYAPVRPLFRQDGAAMLALSSAMTLTALDWQRCHQASNEA